MTDSSLLTPEPDGATPLGPDDLVGLIPTWVIGRSDLNEAEQINIVEAMRWAFGRTWTVDVLLTEAAIRRLHQRMFSDVWTWAGKPRLRETSIGVAPSQISVQLRDLLADTRFQVEHAEDTEAVADEIAIRFHHRLVSIHPFPNGNGRHARLAADLLVGTLGGRRFTWGSAEMVGDGEARREYLRALRVADAHFDCGPLLAFARS